MAQFEPPKPGKNKRGVAGLIDRATYSFSRRWLFYFNLFIGIYVGLPILAPVLMNVGATGPAQIIYTAYSPMCHQMASRSFFLFGEQSAYPRALAGTELQPLEAYSADLPEFANVAENDWAAFFLAAREFVGNEHMGYKMALCERDIAIYGFVLLGGLLYAVLRTRIKVKPLPLLLFVLIGMGPIGLDGFSQLFSYMATPLDGSEPQGLLALVSTIFPLRESTPFLRTFTGALFGFMLVWLAYPRIEGGMAGSARDMEKRLHEMGDL